MIKNRQIGGGEKRLHIGGVDVERARVGVVDNGAESGRVQLADGHTRLTTLGQLESEHGLKVGTERREYALVRVQLARQVSARVRILDAQSDVAEGARRRALLVEALEQARRVPIVSEHEVLGPRLTAAAAAGVRSRRGPSGGRVS